MADILFVSHSKSDSDKLHGSYRVQQDLEPMSHKEGHVSKEVVKVNVTGVRVAAPSKNCRLAPGHSESFIKNVKSLG